MAEVRSDHPTPSRADRPLIQGRRVLVVDDDPLQLKLLRIHLEQMGFEVATATGGAEALDQLRRISPDAVVSDVLMPGLNGFQLCHSIRQDPALAGVPVLLTSAAFSEEADRRIARRMGASALVERTPDSEELIERLLESIGTLPALDARCSMLDAREGPLRPRASSIEHRALPFSPKHRASSIEHQATERVTVMGTQFGILADLAEALRRAEPIEEVLERLLRQWVDAAGASRGAAYILEPGGDLSLPAQVGCPDGDAGELPALLSQADLLDHVLQRGEPLRLPSPDVTPDCGADLLARVGARSLLLAPLVAAEERLGLLVILSREGEPDAEWLPFAKAAGSQIGQAISRARALCEAEKQRAQLIHAQKMENVGRLAGGIAHDFNNMLGAITGYSHILLERLGPEDPTCGPLQEILKAAERAEALTRRLLIFSRKDTLSLEPLDVNEVLAGLDKMLRRLIGADVELITLLDPEVGHVKADLRQLEQALVNLAINARDAMPSGGKLTIEIANVQWTEASPGRCAGMAPGSYVMLQVSDTGCGMDAETQQRIFEPFFTTKAQGKGTGLGLATVHAIIQQFGGCITVESACGQGTTFRIYLPRTEEETPQEQTPAAPAAAARGSETILLAEDEELVRQMIRAVLEASGYTVLEAAQGDEALRLCREHDGPIDLLLTDVIMPGVCGGELARHAAELRPGLKTLFMSGYAEETLGNHGIAADDAPFLRKPFAPADLARKVREVLS